VGPIWAGGGFGEAETLASCYRRSLEVAAEHEVQSIAFPSLGTGVHGYDIKAASKIAVRCVRELLAKGGPIREVIFCCYSDEDLGVHERELANMSHQ
jgi:O-acetyl-ADP-ribose deacetylase